MNCVSEAELCTSLYIQKPCVAVFKGLGIHNYEIYHGAFNDPTVLSDFWNCQHIICMHLGEAYELSVTNVSVTVLPVSVFVICSSGKDALYNIVAFAKESVSAHVTTLRPENFPRDEKEPWLVDFFAPVSLFFFFFFG